MISFQQQQEMVSAYVERLFNILTTPDLVYHNLLHTQNVVNRCGEIASNYSLNEKDHFILITAAWFHDSGHLLGAAKGHEERSVDVMERYMQNVVVEQAITKRVAECIRATKLPAKPTSLVASILCDADLYHLGTTEFLITDELVKTEFELRGKILPANHYHLTLAMLQKHHYFTDYCRALLREGKQKNIEFVERVISEQ